MILTRKLRTSIRVPLVLILQFLSLFIGWTGIFYALGLDHIHHTAGVGVMFSLLSLVWFVTLFICVVGLAWGHSRGKREASP